MDESEYVTDISSLIIDALVMRDPGGYAPTSSIVLVEEQVLDEPWFDAFRGVFDVRTRLLRDHAVSRRPTCVRRCRAMQTCFPP